MNNRLSLQKNTVTNSHNNKLNADIVPYFSLHLIFQKIYKKINLTIFFQKICKKINFIYT